MPPEQNNDIAQDITKVPAPSAPSPTPASEVGDTTPTVLPQPTLTDAAGDAGEAAVSTTPGDEEAIKKHQQYIIHVTNQLRIKKLEINDAGSELARLARELIHMEEEQHHIEQDIRRVEGELAQRESSGNKQENTSKTAQYQMREKDMELKRRSSEIAKLEAEIAGLRREIAEKERRAGEIKEAARSAAKVKEDLRRKIELESAGTKTKSLQAHGKQVEIDRLKQDIVRKRAAIHQKKITPPDKFHSKEDIARDVARMEGEVAHVEQEIRRLEGELRTIESAARKDQNDFVADRNDINKKEYALRQGSDEMVKLERECDRIRTDIKAKEAAIAEVKGESQEFMKGKEELRRQYELGHFSASGEFARAKEMSMHLERFRQELKRKSEEIADNKQTQKETKQRLMFLEQDAAALEAVLRKG